MSRRLMGGWDAESDGLKARCEGSLEFPDFWFQQISPEAEAELKILGIASFGLGLFCQGTGDYGGRQLWRN